MSQWSDPFTDHAAEYDRWFDEHSALHAAELATLQELIPPGEGLEVGVGSGRFAAPLGVRFGLDPARPMLERARERGIAVCQGHGEALPFRDGTFDFVLMVTVVCFARDLDALLREARRVIRPEGAVVIGLIDPDSPLGRRYRARAADSRFYQGARFVPLQELLLTLKRVGLAHEQPQFRQTLAGEPDDGNSDFLRITPGHGEGAFVALRARAGTSLP